MSSASALYGVMVGDSPEGEVFKNRGRWHWLRPNGSTETFFRGATMLTVRRRIARLCLVVLPEVKLVKTGWPMTKEGPV